MILLGDDWMKNLDGVFHIDNSGWPEKGEPLSDVFVKFPFTFHFTDRDIQRFKTEHAGTSFGFDWLYVSDDKIYIHRGLRCIFQIHINLNHYKHTAVYYHYQDIDMFYETKPKEILLTLLRKWSDPASEAMRTIQSVAYGHAIADALGVPVEFMSRQELKLNPVRDMMGYGTHNVPAGTWSDDTSMALATMDSLTLGVNFQDMMRKFESWKMNASYTATGDVFDIGVSTHTAITRFQKGTPALDCGCYGEDDNGNGSLMRIYPAALYWFYPKLESDYRDVLDNFVFDISRLTHAHLRSKLACGIYTYILLHLLRNRTKKGILDGLYDAQNHFSYQPEYINELKHFERLFDVNFSKLPEAFIKSSGYVVHSLEAAIWCLLNTNSYSECVLKAVNLGSDTDTVAAIAGALAGCLYGIDSIPEQWLDGLLRRDMIDDVCRRFTDSLFKEKSPKETHYVIDTHGHYVFGIDDGAVDIEMSLAMLRKAREQGVQAIICTSHSWGNYGKYRQHFEELQRRIILEKIDVTIYQGTEIECNELALKKSFEELNAGVVRPLGKSKYLMFEFDRDIRAKEILCYVKQLMDETEYIPVIAHAERYLSLSTDEIALKTLQHWNVPIQINAYSLVEEQNQEVRDFARKLLNLKFVTFIGSDAHRIGHRPPNVRSGVDYIYANCDIAYAHSVCFDNAKKLLINKHPGLW